jgi:hypothetical protein
MTGPLRRGYFPADLATGQLDDVVADQLATFLAEVASVRELALSVPTAFNALAFGFDLESRRYTNDLVAPEELPLVTLNDSVDVLPSGALLRLRTASQPLACEVLYREGEHAEVESDGTIPTWLSGAPQGATEPLRSAPPVVLEAGDAKGGCESKATVTVGDEILVRERLVIDYSILDSSGAARVRRLDSRFLTPERHLVVLSRYNDAEEADLPESRLYGRYLIHHQTALLTRVLHRAGLGPENSADWSPADLGAKLDAALVTVEALLWKASDLIQWRETWIPHRFLDTFGRRHYGVGAEDVQDFARGLASEAISDRRRHGPSRAKPAYRALGAALRSRDSDHIATHGPKYGTMIACANLIMTQLLEESGRALEVRGTRVHIRLDDAFQGGGIWRAEQVEDDVDLDPVDLPLALGWRESAEPSSLLADPLNTTIKVTEARVPSSGAVTGDDSSQRSGEFEKSNLVPVSVAEREPVDTRSDDTIMSWKFVLTPRTRASSTIRLTQSVADTMAHVGETAPFQIRFHHPGIELALSQQPVKLEGSGFVGVRWPPQFFIGMLLYASWSRDGYFVTVEGQQLAEPAILDGIPLDYAFDEETVLRSWGTPTDLVSPDEELGPAVVLQILRLAGLRAEGATATTLFLPLETLIAHVGCDARAVGLDGVELTTQVEGIVDLLSRRSSAEGSIIVEWAIGIPTSDPGAERGWYLRPLPGGDRSGCALCDLAVTLRLGAKIIPRSDNGPSESWVIGSRRRGHPRVLTRGTPSAAKRAQLLEWARDNGWDPSWLSPRTTFVEETTVRSYLR